MSIVTVERDGSYAPGAYLVVEQGFDLRDEEHTAFFDLDQDRPSLAANLGFVACERCGFTDGTVDCSHETASNMIAAAGEWLDEHLGVPFEDPGYLELN